MRLLLISAIFVAAVSTGLGLAVWSRRWESPSFRRFGVACLTIGAWAIFFALGELFPFRPYREIHWLLHFWLGPVVLAFLTHFFGTQNDRVVRVLFFLSVLGGSVATLSFFWIRSIAEVYGAFLPSVLLLHTIWIALRGSLRRLQVLWVSVLCLVLLTVTMDHFPSLPLWIPTIGNLILCGLLYVIAVQVQKLRMISVREGVKQVFLYTCMSLILGGLIGWISILARGDFYLFFFSSFLLCFVVASLLPSLKSILEYGMHLLPGSDLDPARQAFVEAQKDLEDEIRVPDGIANLVKRLNVFGLLRMHIQISEDRWYDSHEKFTSRALIHGLSDEERRSTRDPLEIYSYETLQSEVSSPFKNNLKDVLKDLSARYALVLWDTQGFAVVAFLVIPDESSVLARRPEILFGLEPLLKALYQIYLTEHRVQVSEDQDRELTLSEMAAGLAHELKNPLGILRGAVEMLETRYPELKDKRYLNIISEETDRMNHLLTHFLEFSKPVDLGHLQRVELNQLLQRVTSHVAVEDIVDVDLVLESHVLEASVLGNEDAIFQVIMNIIRNSMRASKEAGGKKEIRMVLEADSSLGNANNVRNIRARGWVRIWIEDHGVGMSAIQLRKAFVPFYSTDSKGIGLGLPLSRRIIVKLGGDIDIQSEWQKGTRVCIRLPRL